MRVGQAVSLVRGVSSRGVKVPVLLVGSMGVGKSAVPKAVALELGISLIDLRLAQQEPGDLIGLPRQNGDRTFWSKPSWWPEPESRGILFLDELNRAPVDVRQAVFQLVSEWRLHTHELPAGWSIVSAINPEGGDYQVETLDIAMLRRFCQVKVEPSVPEWAKWAERSGLHKEIVGFVRANGKLLWRREAIRLEARPTPEGYRLIHELLSNQAIPKGLEQEVFCGVIGLEAGTALHRHMELGTAEFVSGMAVVEDFPSHAEAIAQQDNGQLAATVESVAEALASGTLLPAQLLNLRSFLRSLKPEWRMNLLAGLLPNEALLRQLSSDPELNRELIGLRADAAAKGKGKAKKRP